MPTLTDEKQKWIQKLGLCHDNTVIDCDLNKRTVTFNTKDGPMERQIVESWSRVMGYHRPIESWNTGKLQEHKDRKMYKTFNQESFQTGTTNEN